MATDQVLKWMKGELQLSQEVRSFEADFSSGYLFGEILVQYGICKNIRDFVNKNTKEARVNNFYQIEDALRRLKVRFDGKTIHNIMQEERGASLRLLYQMKLALQKLQGAGPDQTEEITTTGLKMSTVQRVVQKKHEQTLNLGHTIQARTVGGKDIRSQKQKNQDAHLLKYEVAQKVLFDDAYERGKAEEELIATIQLRKRQDNIRKLKENQEFMKEWEDEGKANWRQNQRTRAENIAKVKFFEDREVNIYKQKLNKELQDATEEMQYGFSEYDKNLQKLGIELNVNMDDALKRMEEKQGIPPGQIQNFSYAATINKIKETKKQSDFAGKERERRRRKLAVDQAVTQERLDKQKEQDALVEKLLRLQKEEHQQAYIENRTTKCKNLIAENRRNKAIDVEIEREQKFKEIEEKRIAATLALEPQRKREYEEAKIEHQNFRREEKRVKRSLNVEICSEVTDLLLDLAEEVFQTSLNQHGKKLSKAQWREFTDLFADGKKVSLRNVKKTVLSNNDEEINCEKAEKIQTNKELKGHQILQVYKDDPALFDMYEFMGSSGAFNLSQICNDLFIQVAGDYSLQIESTNGFYLNNPHVGERLEALLKDNSSLMAQQTKSLTVGGQSLTKSSLEWVKEFPLKLAILGRTFSGKKTIANQLQKKFGQQNFRIFNMDQIIQEALEYIAPKKVDDNQGQVDPKSKGKKGKEEVIAVVDIFEGRSTDAYKDVANQIKDQFFEDYDGENLQKTDLAACVLDDQLLVQLFIERLKLEYEGEPIGNSLEEIEAGLLKEKELLLQLEEIQDGANTGDAAPAKKGGKEKGKGGKVSDEQIKEELDQLRQVKIKGWAIVDFPRNLTQMKYLESHLSGFDVKADWPKDQEKSRLEALSQVAYPNKLNDPENSNESKPYESGLDSLVILDTPLEECLRRSQNRKIDPSTNTVYHMEDSPPEDPKLLEKLQDFSDEAGQSERIQETSKRYNSQINLIQQFSQRFGLYNETFNKGPIQQELCVKFDEQDQWRNKHDVFAQVEEQIQAIIDFRQLQYECHREEIRKQMEEKQQFNSSKGLSEKSKSAMSKEVSQDNLAPGGKQDNDGQSKKGATTSALSAQPDKIKVEEHQDGEDNGPVSNRDQNASLFAKLREGGMQSGTFSATSKKGYSDHGGQSQSAFGRSGHAKSSISYQRIVFLPDSQKIGMMEEMMTTYFKANLTQFSNIRSLRQRVFKNLKTSQREFLTFLERKSDMQKKLNDFCESYNRFSHEFPDLLDNEETREELMNRIKILSQQMWEVIKQRKNQAMEQRSKFMEGGWVQVEMAKLVLHVAKMLENEFSRFKAICTLMHGMVLNQGSALFEMAKRFQDKGMESYIVNPSDVAKVGQSPILKELVSAVMAKLDSYLKEEFVQNASPKHWESIAIEKKNFVTRINTLITWTLLLLNEIHYMSFQVFDVLDDWVVVAIKKENQASQKVVKIISEQVQQGVEHIDSIIMEDLDLGSSIEFIQFTEGPPRYVTKAKPILNLECLRFEIDTLNSFSSQFAQKKEDVKLIDSETFTALLHLNLREGNLPQIWKYIQTENVAYFKSQLVGTPLMDQDALDARNHQSKQLFRSKSFLDNTNETRCFIDWRKALLAFTLIATPFPTNDQKQDYFKALRACGNILSKKQFTEVSAWFDAFEGLNNTTEKIEKVDDSTLNDSTEGDDDDGLDEVRIRNLKNLLFQTYKVPNREGMWTEEFIKDMNDLFSDKEIAESLKFAKNTKEANDSQNLSQILVTHRSLYHSLLKIDK